MDSSNRIAKLTEDKLITMASKSDLEAFNQLVLNYQDMVYNHAYIFMGDSDAAEDVAQDSFLRAFQGIKSFRGGSFRGWLLRIATNSAYDILRRSQRHPTQPLYLEDKYGEDLESAMWLANPTSSVQETVEQDELSEEIRLLMNKLPKTYRNVLLLVDLYEFEYKEVAETLRIPIGTVKSRIARARFQMKKLLQENVRFSTTLSTHFSAS